MKQTIQLRDFVREFEEHDGRAQQLGGREGLRMLFDYLEEMERDAGEEMELDVIGLCCDYACSTLKDVVSYYSIPIDPEDNYEMRLGTVLEYINDRSVAVGVLNNGGRILYRQF